MRTAYFSTILLFPKDAKRNCSTLPLYTTDGIGYAKKDYKQAEQLIQKHPLPEGTKPDHILARLDFLQRYYTEQADWKKHFNTKSI